MGYLYICGATKGKYSSPAKSTNESPQKCACEHPKHWGWGRGTRNGQKLYYPIKDMFIQKWELTEEEFERAVKEYDMFSLEVEPRIICKNCAKKEGV